MSSFTQPPNYIDPPSQGWKVTDADLITLPFAFLAVAARCYTKVFLVKSRGWDDYTIVIALCIAIARLAVDMAGTHQYGAGRHFRDIPPEYYNGYLTTIAVDGYLYVVAITLAKISLLIFLYRIFRVDRTFRIIAWVFGAIVGVWATITVFMAIFSCRPVSASWNLKLRMDPSTVCKPESYDVENIFGFCNVISDVFLAFLPIHWIWKMKMNTKKKLGVAMVFATGAFICAVAIVRQCIAYTSGQSMDPSWGIIRIKIWMAIEVNAAIVVACLPALSPLFKRIPLLASLVPSSIRSRFSHPSAMERAPWPKKLSGPIGDLERGETPSKNHAAHASWSKPKAWRDAEREEFGGTDSESEESKESPHSLQPVYHARVRTSDSSQDR